MEPDGLQHNCSAVCAITQQYSTTFVSTLYHSYNKISSTH